MPNSNNNEYLTKILRWGKNEVTKDVQKFTISSSMVAILVISTAAIALADESILTQSFLDYQLNDISELTPHGHIEDFSWMKKVSKDGVIEISGISFSVVNDGKIKNSFEICTVIQGPFGTFTPSLNSPLACTITHELVSNEKIMNQSIDLPKGVKVSELVDISITIQEL